MIESALLRRGEASRARGNLRAALADVDRACTLDARNARCFDDRAQVHAELKEMDKAAADFDAALRIDPGLVHARLGRIRLREARDDRPRRSMVAASSACTSVTRPLPTSIRPRRASSTPRSTRT